MPSLSEKVRRLRCEAMIAARHAIWWQNVIGEHGEEKATEFYKSLGLNHLETGNQQPKVNVTVNLQGDDSKLPKYVTAHLCDTKSFEWEGLTLSREPRPSEVLAVKGVSQAQESAKESITKILLDLRTELIADGLKGIKKLKPATYHELTLQASKESRSQLRERLVKVHKQGRLLVAAELGKTGKVATAPLQGTKEYCAQFTNAAIWGEPASVRIAGRAVAGNPFEKKEAQVDEEDGFDLLDDLVDLSNSRIANEVQVRITAATARYRLLGLGEAALWKAVEDEIRLGSVSYIDRASAGLAHKVVNIGRGDEAERRKDEWGRVEYSALLDTSVCGPCASEDGKTATSEDDLQPAPNPECEGGDWCRCFHVFIQD